MTTQTQAPPPSAAVSGFRVRYAPRLLRDSTLRALAERGSATLEELLPYAHLYRPTGCEWAIADDGFGGRYVCLRLKDEGPVRPGSGEIEPALVVFRPEDAGDPERLRTILLAGWGQLVRNHQDFLLQTYGPFPKIPIEAVRPTNGDLGQGEEVSVILRRMLNGGPLVQE